MIPPLFRLTSLAAACSGGEPPHNLPKLFEISDHELTAAGRVIDHPRPVEEQIDLLALIMLGRGDYEFAEWDAAVSEAEGRIAARDPDYMIGDAALPEYLGDGLEAFDKTCE